jgi:hypothetical protein
VFLKARLQIGIGGGLGHFRKRFHKLIFGGIEVFEFIRKQVFQRLQHTYVRRLAWALLLMTCAKDLHFLKQPNS